MIGHVDFYIIVAEQVTTNETTDARNIGHREALLKIGGA